MTRAPTAHRFTFPVSRAPGTISVRDVTPPATFEIVQGVEMGRQSRLTVSIVPGEEGVRVSGNAVTI